MLAFLVTFSSALNARRSLWLASTIGGICRGGTVLGRDNRGKAPLVASTFPWTIAIRAVGWSGLFDMQALLAPLTPEMSVVVLIVLDQRFDRRSHLVDFLARATALPVFVAGEGERFERGCCYIGEPAAHLVLAERSFGALVKEAGTARRSRTIDLLFRSMAAGVGKRFISVVLSGALDDGPRGMAAIHAAGGRTMVITSNTLRGPGIPESKFGFDGPIDCAGSVDEIARTIHRFVGT
jgi:chemotaxis response regulator CheB